MNKEEIFKVEPIEKVEENCKDLWVRVKLYCGCFKHYATIWLDEIKNMEQNGAYWFIEMKDGNVWEDATNAVITYDENEKIGYFVENEN